MHKDDVARIAAGLVLSLSSPIVRGVLKDGRPSNWKVDAEGTVSRTLPFPVCLYPDDSNLYWARGWGCHQWLWPWERWLLRRTVRAHLTENRDEQ